MFRVSSGSSMNQAGLARYATALVIGAMPVLVACTQSGAHAANGSEDSPAPVGDEGDAGSDGDSVPLKESLTTLRVHYPAGARNVSVRGNQGGLDWDHGVGMTRSADGNVFEYTLALPKSVSRLEWKPLLDDATWSRGPNYVAARGATVDVFPRFTTEKGTVTKLVDPFHSKKLANDRVIWVYLPPSYEENSLARFPVAYMHDGHKLFDPQPTLGAGGWRVDATLDKAAEDGSIAEVIVIGISVDEAARDYELTPTSDPSEGKTGGGGHYLQMVASELKPRIDAMLRTEAARSSTALVGSSYGGLLSAWGAAQKDSPFGLVGALSPSTWWDDRALLDVVAASQAPRPDRVYVDCGGAADGKADTDDLVATYRGLGYVEGKTLRYVVKSAPHDESAWSARFPGAMQFLFGARQP